MVNKVILIGNLGADPEMRSTQSGTQIANLRLATTERRKVGDEWQDHTEWHRVTCFGRTAENVGRFLRKGRQCYVEGRLSTRKWTDKDGADRWTTEVLADQVRFIGGRSEDGASDQRTSQQGRGGRTQQAGDAYRSYGADAEDIPF